MGLIEDLAPGTVALDTGRFKSIIHYRTLGGLAVVKIEKQTFHHEGWEEHEVKN